VGDRLLLTDSHCHLNFTQLLPYLDGIDSSCDKRGVRRFIVPATRQDDWSKLQDLASKHSGIYFSLGCHPLFEHHEQDRALSCLSALLAQDNSSLVAVGEVGLDYRLPNRKEQMGLFHAQALLAREFEKPLIVHSVRAHSDVLRTLKSVGVSKAVVHAFSGSYEEAMQFVDQGYYLGVGSVLLRSKGKTLKALARVPIDSLVLETDSPDMYLPTSYTQIGTPIDVVAIARALADLRGLELAHLARQTERNVDALFGFC